MYELQERLAEPECQKQQCMVDLEVFDSLQRHLHQLGKQAQMLNCALNEQHFAQEALKSELLEQMETFKNVRDSWTLVQDQIEQKRGWLIGETVIFSDPQQCQVKLAGISIHSDLGMCVISGNAEFDMLKISAFSDGVVNNWNNTQPESAISAGDRITSVDGLQGDPELKLNELRTNNKPDMTLPRQR